MSQSLERERTGGEGKVSWQAAYTGAVGRALVSKETTP